MYAPDKVLHRGVLYVVATPIGNLEDITLRAIRILREVQLIAAEDTRRTKKFLHAHEIHTPLTSLYDQIEDKKSSFLISKLNEGMNVAYVSDAGTPGISDPGYVLIRQAIANAIRVVPIPGVSAVIAALSVSGLPMNSFVFGGFLPSRPVKRRQFLMSMKNETRTMVFYESPKRLMSTLHDVKEILGDREVVISRELTKVFEEILRGRVGEVISLLQDGVVKGEVTLLIAGKKKLLCSDDEIRVRFKQLQENTGFTRRDIIDTIAGEMGVSRKRVYREVIKAGDKLPIRQGSPVSG
ncbi:MAG: 16S rRNA (cytidine(1402)-2'-O)-methyltransferase [Syntrophaceae bacterium CG2_30_49_12]|nr:MAG: 16S rRNA (cytidine(1402)-2'-O)-methyltransferase [Syntrophaceae bacterium CG2_30_49_12]PIP06927.1 MAG: 16S rRNA (cytidine(1402)-2'-O)-methyltransferase [Syntrophobacterales bacterium CG23_combo_of_CG06-09_8_20_14_all_48_27]PJA50677.1 MAG: 16S rRNA (cytidine(1402)-2'-O)-methyltransferase [Syntrophobacterales bacterium CG_4_9_14_3_um_filter_49_8]PJC73723.1 MAG: 16S rRNA (cytidine(1402)-2'-O)-methyltransferase [Syntrophobacterales bacterium CG_4_8_14_3_um_filter_49_14]